MSRGPLRRVLAEPGTPYGRLALAGLLGLYLAWFGLSALLTGVLVAWSMAALAVAIGRLNHRRGSLPLGPFLVLGALIAILTA